MKRSLITSFVLATLFAVCGSLVARAEDEASSDPSLLAVGLQVENLRNPVGVGVANPRLSWASRPVTREDSYDKKQTAYQILVSSSPEALEADNGDLWDSGKVESDASLYIEYAGAPLKSFQHCYWKVRVWDNEGDVGPWSAGGTWIQGIDEKDWQAQWIGQPEEVRPDVDFSGASWITAATEKETDAGLAPEYFRKEFEIDLPAEEFEAQNAYGTLYYAACQKFEIFVNGKRAGHSIGMVFNPDQARSIDVSEYLVPGKNVVAFVVANETKRPNGTKFGDGTFYPTALIAKLFVGTLDKSNAPSNLPVPNRFGKPNAATITVGTDSTWLSSVDGGDNWNGLEFDASSWKASKIAFEELDETPWGKLRRRTETVSPCFQKSFEVKKPVAQATLAICAPGLFEAYLNGEKVGDQLLTPSFTRYDRRILYNILDLTDAFQKSSDPNCELQFVLGHSWYDVRSIVTWNFDAAPWRDFPRVLAQLEVVYEDGTSETIATDPTWTYSTSPVLFDCVRQGEIVDGAWEREILGNAVVVPAPLGEPKMVAQKVAVSRALQGYSAKSVKQVKDGVWVVDMGQNNAGWARIRLSGQKKGDVVRFRYSERVVESGEIERHDIDQHFMEGTPAYTTGFKGGFQTDFYFCNGEEEEFFEPRFTYNGYQYIEVVGLREEPKPEDFQGQMVGTDFRLASSFVCSNDLLNKLQEATIRSYRNNFVAGYPTDCPHREKNGWTGDAQLACELAQYNFENTAGYEKWLDDICDEQKSNGDVCAIIPTGDWGYPWGNGPAWDSALVMIPWYVYLYRGDKKILETSYESMKKYVDYTSTRERDNGLVYHGLSDWVYAKTNTPVEVTSTGYYYVDAKIVAQTAKILGKAEDFEKYSQLANRIRDNYNAALYQGDGAYSINSQTSESCAIHQGFSKTLSQEDQASVFARLCENVGKADGHFDVGILGAKYILRTLSEGGRTDLALQMMLQESKPAMADWIRRGAGTLWEDWGEGSSRNHIMFGDFSAWLFQSLCGIKLNGAPDVVVAETSPESVAFKRFVVEPKCTKAETTAPGQDPITSARGFVETPYGPILVDWKRDDEKNELTVRVGVPVNTTATVILPVGDDQKLEITKGAEGAKPVETSKPNVVSYEIGSGSRVFSISPK
ncbi:MAG: family 78 glycoside hydrolase catalytic domain [Thermoguttaceae bacterium]|nr:family 78 glycoside hydrolase catalytic domain [Thermoguttaceae bacterium]